MKIGFSAGGRPDGRAAARARAARSATAPATRAGSACTRSWKSPTAIRELILVGASGLELRRKAVEEGMISLRGSGLQKIKDGVTTIEEVLRETVM